MASRVAGPAADVKWRQPGLPLPAHPPPCGMLPRLPVDASPVDAGHGPHRPASPGRPRPALVPRNLGFTPPSQLALNALAQRHGFTAVEPLAPELAAASPDALAALQADLAARRLVWGATGLTIDFRHDDGSFRAGLAELPRFAATRGRAGASRVGTWIPPASDDLPFGEYFPRLTLRLREMARILGDHGVRLGLEYVATPLARTGRAHAFIHSLAQTRELVAAIGQPNVGFVLDSWHWWCAGESAAELRALAAREIVSVDLNDAPRGVPRAQQQDKVRELPLATGVIDLRAFLQAVHATGYDGPVRCEPFNAQVSALGPDRACAAASDALHRALALLAP
jgi:sugar phosphate isomerase/epimerase